MEKLTLLSLGVPAQPRVDLSLGGLGSATAGRPVGGLGGATGVGPSLGLAAQPQVDRWLYVRRRFEGFQQNLSLTSGQNEDGIRKQVGVVKALNSAYYGNAHGHANRMLIGSWGKNTRVRPPRDIDLIYVPPIDVFYQFDQRSGNKQSQLLQDVAAALRDTYPQTVIRGDGQVVVIDFYTCRIEVVPGFRYDRGGFLICDTNKGGRWKHVDPEGEIFALNCVDGNFNGNLRKLTRMLKQWQRHCDVPIKSFHLEALLKEMLATKDYGGYDEFWFDWLVRDAFRHLISRVGGTFFMPGSACEQIWIGDAWLTKAETAYKRALKACDYERDNYEYLAGSEWQKIFGNLMPQATT